MFLSQINASFQRESAALACRRFKGKHSYDRIAEMIHDIHCEFKLDAKKNCKSNNGQCVKHGESFFDV